MLTGPHAGTKAQAMPPGIARLLDMDFPFSVRLSADEYQDAEFDVTSDSVTLYPHYSIAEIHLQMKPLQVKVRPQIDYPSVALRLRVTYPH